MSTIYETLNSAADLLQKDGWTQEDYISENGRCALGAIYHLTDDNGMEPFGDPDLVNTEIFLSDYLTQAASDEDRKRWGIGESVHVPSWNDEPGRTAEEVIATMRAAALVAETADAKATEEVNA